VVVDSSTVSPSAIVVVVASEGAAVTGVAAVWLELCKASNDGGSFGSDPFAAKATTKA
jgi:hypothetical protein